MSHIRACCKDDDIQNAQVVYESLVLSGSASVKRSVTPTPTPPGFPEPDDDTDEIILSFSHDPVTLKAPGTSFANIGGCCGPEAEFAATGTMTRTEIENGSTTTNTTTYEWELTKLRSISIQNIWIQDSLGYALVFARITVDSLLTQSTNGQIDFSDDPQILEFMFAFNSNPNGDPFATGAGGTPPSGTSPGGFVPPWFADTIGPIPAPPSPTNAYTEPDLDVDGNEYSKIAIISGFSVFPGSLLSPGTVVLPFGQDRTETFESSASLSASGIFRNEVPQDQSEWACAGVSAFTQDYKCP